MPPIHQLSPSVVNKIAAGEVIERPASVVKELLENSVDSGATRIDLALEQGGSEAIRVSDNGCGIEPEGLPLAVASHATSKITSADDLFSVATLGFRGEALASIASVSRLAIRSRTPERTEGAELEVVGGQSQPIVPVGCPAGTTIEVRRLFFNTPVRHKFLRTPQTESGHATEAFTRLALGHPNIHFSLTSGGRVAHELPPAVDLRQRIRAFYGGDLVDALVEIDNEADGIRLSGYVGNPSLSRGNNRLQYIFLNGRAIRDRALQHALGEAYRGLILSGRYPICFLRLEMPPEWIDVNVHPTKQEVRFQDSGRIYSHLLGTLRTRFLTTDLTARAKLPASDDATMPERPQEVGQLVDWAKEQLAEESAARPPGDAAGPRPTVDRGRRPLSLHRLDSPHIEAPTTSPVGTANDAPAAPQAVGEHGRRALQIHNRYLVAETDDGLEVIDQHALHERILFERIRDKVAREALEAQKLLVPEPVDLAAGEAALVLEHADLLARLGLEVSSLGGETVLVSSYPAMLARTSPADAMREIVERLSVEAQHPQPHDLLEELLHTVACKAAVKYGDALEPDEIDALLADRHLIRDQHHCPHGRPTTLVFTRDELDRQFKRI